MNKLQYESSPYLLQHARNPVEWYAWKPEAFERARAEQKPILVSIGYSTCHWCHVMERESFENEAVASLMNRHFINIKVDREERPDIDAIYMEACQILTGGGGWPLNCFLTPEGKPFYAGTYFPPAPAYNRPSWTDLLTHLANIWEEKRDTALDQAERLTGHIRKDAPPVIAKPDLVRQESNITDVLIPLKRQFDPADGGFGGAPKFPSTMAIQLLLELSVMTGDAEASRHALFSLEKMISGGIYDQVGGGFSRYATDREWLVPHFEKMLYDNALLVTVLADAYKFVAGKGPGSAADPYYATLFSETIEETLAYITREMTAPDGGFYSAQDADSEGVEGKFYVWEKAEIEALLSTEAAGFADYYGVTEAGNWEEKNILYRAANPLEHKKLEAQREKLLRARAQRVKPLLDTKILLDWNALMATGFARAFSALGHDEYRQTAVRNIEFLLKHLRSEAPEAGALPFLHHSATQPYAFLDDYAFFIAALTDVYEITFEERYLQLAAGYTEYVIRAFSDAESPLFYFVAVSQNDILLRKKDLYDNATPSGNSVMLHNLQKLGILLDRPEWRTRAAQMLKEMEASVMQFPLSFSKWACGRLHEQLPPVEIAVVGKDALEKALALQAAFLPNAVLAGSRGSNSQIPLLSGKDGGDDALIYLCRDFACQKPVVSLNEFWDML